MIRDIGNYFCWEGFDALNIQTMTHKPQRVLWHDIDPYPIAFSGGIRVPLNAVETVTKRIDRLCCSSGFCKIRLFVIVSGR